jgi:hypothetical protein
MFERHLFLRFLREGPATSWDVIAGTMAPLKLREAR